MDGNQWRDVYAELKRCVLKAVLKVTKVAESRTEAGILNTDGPWTLVLCTELYNQSALFKTIYFSTSACI